MHFNSKDDKIYQVICLGLRCCSQFLYLYRIMDAIYQKEMSVSLSSCLKQAERGMDMNPKQYFFSLKESHHVRVSDSLPTAWSRLQSHNYLSRQQSARFICQLARAGLAGHPREKHLLLFCTDRGARGSIMLCARNQCLLPT